MKPLTLALALGLVTAAVVVWRRNQAEPITEATASEWDTLDRWVNELSETVNSTMTNANTDNRAAFLKTIRYAEGTVGANGYRTLFGGGLFNGYADHPRIAKRFIDKQGRTLWTSAAGAYQFLAISPLPSGGKTKVDTWDRLKQKLGLPDFSPSSQDAAAIELLRENGALSDVDNGDFEDAINKVRRVWASLPGAGYAQPEKSMDTLTTVYLNAGGYLA